MDPLLQKYYEDVLALFNEPGWKAVVEDLTALRTKLNDVRSVTNLDMRKGELSMLDHFIGLPAIFEMAYKQLQAESAE